MRFNSKWIATAVTGCAALAVSAAPASAAQEPGPQTVTSDAGTTCTVKADATVERGLLGVLIRPVAFSGTVDCTLADPSNVPVSSGAIALTSSQVLGLGTTGGRPNDPVNNVAVPSGNNEQGPSYRCEVAPGVDCGFSGRNELAPAGNYKVVFGAGITPPEGETWTSLSAGCQLDGGESGAVNCASEKAVTVR